MKKKIIEEFPFPHNFKINWFPGHMNKTYKLLPEQIKKIDLFLELRDSRIPLSSGNPEIPKLLTENIKHIILFNKYDICDQVKTRKIVETNFPGIKTLYSTAKHQQNLKKIIDLLQKEVSLKFKTVGIWCMVGGLPNVGKSTLINNFKQMNLELREVNKKTAKTEATATTTRHIDFFKVNENPNIYIMDTPGIIMPKIDNNDIGLKLSVCGNIKDKIVGKQMICEYLLYLLNRYDYLEYIKVFKTEEKVTSLDTLLRIISKEFKITDKNNACDLILKNFQLGKLGKVTLDNENSTSLNKL